jgi:rubredoxin
MIGYVVYCEVCGHGWDERSPEVRWLNIDRAWTCTDESACFERAAAAVTR